MATSDAPTTMSGFIDVHAHYTLPIDAAQRDTLVRSFQAAHFLAPPTTSWSPEEAIAFMDSRGIACQLLSSPGDLLADQAKQANDYGAALVAAHPGRFGLLANLPLSDPRAAATEVDRALDNLQADGFALVSNYGGAYLGDPRFAPVFAALDRRGATLLLHPGQPAGFAATACGRPGPVIEFPFDTARTVVDALYARLFERYPHVHVILAHGGGALPVLAARIASVGTLPWVPNPQAITSTDVTTQLASLYYDTAIASTPHSLLPMLQTTRADHIVFGTDYPPASAAVIDANMAALAASPALTPKEVAAMAPTTLRLFPALHSRLRRGI